MAVTTLLKPDDRRILTVFGIYDKILGFSGYMYYKRTNYLELENVLDASIEKAIKSVYPNSQLLLQQTILFKLQEENIMKPYLMGIRSDFEIIFMPEVIQERLFEFNDKTYQIIESKFNFNILIDPKSEMLQFVRKSVVCHYETQTEEAFLKSLQTVEL